MRERFPSATFCTEVRRLKKKECMDPLIIFASVPRFMRDDEFRPKFCGILESMS